MILTMRNSLERLRCYGDVTENVPMSTLTTLRIGGNARAVVYPKTMLALTQVLRLLAKQGIPYKIFGKGSNLLCSDNDYEGVILKLDRYHGNFYFDSQTVVAEAGCSIIALSYEAMKHSLSGLEFASGIPGTLGGTVSMNAGAYEKEMKDIVNSVRILTQEGEIKEISNAEMAFGYRTSAVLKNNWIVLGATLQLQQDDPVEIQARIDDFTHRRRTRQPLEYASAGSTFKRPEGFFAAKLIDDAGMKGYSVGDAQVSEKHAGFVVNKGKASAEDVLVLMSRIQAAVKEKFGVDLKPEVRIIGE